MGIIDDQNRFISFAQFDELRQVANIAFHAEDAVGHNPATGCRAGCLELLFELVQVAMAVDHLVNALHHQTHTIDDAGVVEFVREHGIFSRDEGWK